MEAVVPKNVVMRLRARYSFDSNEKRRERGNVKGRYRYRSLVDDFEKSFAVPQPESSLFWKGCS